MRQVYHDLLGLSAIVAITAGLFSLFTYTGVDLQKYEEPKEPDYGLMEGWTLMTVAKLALVYMTFIASVSGYLLLQQQKKEAPSWAATQVPDGEPAAPSGSRAPGRDLADAIGAESEGLSPEQVWATPAHTAPSAVIASFPSHPAVTCWGCFEAENRLSQGVVRKLYTNEDGVFESLNLSLGAAERRAPGPLTAAYTQLLAEALHDERRRAAGKAAVPKRLYRGLRTFGERQQAAFAARVGGKVYLHAFTSASADPTVALRFAQPSGWRLLIDVYGGGAAAECCAAVHKRAECDEAEVLVSANAGFRVDAVDRAQKLVRLTLVDESHCLRAKPHRQCARCRRKRA